MHLVLFILKALVVVYATALPQETNNNDLLNQDQPYQDQSAASTSDQPGIQNYVAFYPDNLDIPSTIAQDTSRGDNSDDLTELTAASNPMLDDPDSQNSGDEFPAEPQENIADSSSLTASTLGTSLDATLPYCDEIEKSEVPPENLNNLISRDRDEYLIAMAPVCPPGKGPTCCKGRLRKKSNIVYFCSPVCMNQSSSLHCEFYVS